MTAQKLRLISILVSIFLVVAGCTGSDGQARELPNDGPAPPTSRAAALSFVRKALTAGQSAAENQSITLVLTDAEVTSFLGLRAELTRDLEKVGIEQIGQVEGLEELGSGDLSIEAWRGLFGTDGQPRERLIPRLRIGLREPQVYFKADGRIIARGYLALLKWRMPVRAVVTPRAVEGEMELDFVEGQIGKVKAPEFLFDLLGKGIAEALLAGQAYAEITQIHVQAGTLTISGRYNR
ncbi:MAG: hypothetical protein J7M39_13805 [Anaerolineae bacterium]|nr:hypothetical protein [Anaerolineae bacterium]